MHLSSTAIVFLFLMGLSCEAESAKKNKAEVYVWKTDIVPCGIGNGPVVESAGLAALAPVLLERGFDLLASTIRKAIQTAAEDKQTTIEVKSASYLVELKNLKSPPADSAKGCVVVAYGKPSSPGGIASALSFLPSDADTATRTSVKSDLARLSMSEVAFYARVAFEQSSDQVATRAVLKQIYYPDRLYSGRSSAERVLSVAVIITQPGDDKAVLAGTLTLENLSTSPILILGSAVDSKNAIGWFPTPTIELSAQQKATTGEKVPVNLTSTVTETARGSAFFKALNTYLDDKTWSALTEAGKTTLLPDKRAEARSNAKSAYESSIVAYFSAIQDLNESCNNLKDKDSPSNRSSAWRAYYAASSAYRLMISSRVSGVTSPASVDTPIPAPCKTP